MKYIDSPVVRSLLPEQIGSEEHPIRSPHLKEPVAESHTPLVERLRSGLPMAEFRCLLTLLNIPEEELGRLLGISPATLHRRKKSGQLGTPESERIVRFARLFGLAMEVFESEQAARQWLKAPNPGTAAESPLSYADTEFGAREVENLLGRIEHGVFS
jgi:putative toxin-antitoxin system antitoxin component (TIGR02293 family)